MDAEKRIELLKSYILDDPSDVFSKYALALEYIKAGKDEMAEPLMNEIHTIHTGYLPNYYHFGKLYERKGNFKAAAGIYSLGIELAKLQGDGHTMGELTGALENLD